jgi:hypothetical protein
VVQNEKDLSDAQELIVGQPGFENTCTHVRVRWLRTPSSCTLKDVSRTKLHARVLVRVRRLLSPSSCTLEANVHVFEPCRQRDIITLQVRVAARCRVSWGPPAMRPLTNRPPCVLRGSTSCDMGTGTPAVPVVLNAVPMHKSYPNSATTT